MVTCALLLGVLPSASAFDVTVGNEAQLNSNIAMFNAQTSGSHIIRLGENISLTNPLTSITNGFAGTTLTIESSSPSALRAIDGNNAHQIISISGNSRVVFRRIEFRNGYNADDPNDSNDGNTEGNGGAINIAANSIVSMSSCYFKNNKAIGPGQFATSGGAIAIGSGGTLSVFASTFENNTAPNGGGAISFGGGSSGFIVASTFENNQVLSSFGRGGAVVVSSSGTLDISQSTFHMNQVATNASPRSDGLHNDGGSIQVASNLFADACVSFGGNVTDNGNNLFPTGANASCGLANGVNGNIVSPTSGLGSYGFFGGLTKTIELDANSPAIDAGKIDFVNRSDQRGITRNNDDPDIGAFEFIKDDEFEPNDSLETATLIAEPRTLSQITMEGSQDWFRFQLPADKEASFAARFSDLLADIDLELLDETGAVLASSLSVSDDELISYTPTQSGTYFLSVSRFGSVGQTYYDLELNFESSEFCVPIVSSNNNVAVICL
jgi:hypothetical protein